MTVEQQHSCGPKMFFAKSTSFEQNGKAGGGG